MKAVRILIAAVLLVWSPLSGVMADTLGVSLSHHHCDNAWHGHDGNDRVVQGEEDCGFRTLNTDAWGCDDCNVVQAALPGAVLSLERPQTPRFHLTAVASAQTHFVFSHFRPPKA